MKLDTKKIMRVTPADRNSWEATVQLANGTVVEIRSAAGDFSMIKDSLDHVDLGWWELKNAYLQQEWRLETGRRVKHFVLRSEGTVLGVRHDDRGVPLIDVEIDNGDEIEKLKKVGEHFEIFDGMEHVGGKYRIVARPGELEPIKPKPKPFEDTIFDEGMAVNTVAALNRLLEILGELKTNSLKSVAEDPRVRRMMWFLNAQVFGTTSTINMIDEWYRLYDEKKKENIC